MLAALRVPAALLRRSPAVNRLRHMAAAPRQDGKAILTILKNKTPAADATGVFFFRSLAMTYSHMGKPQTTIGDASFHF